MSPIQTSRRHFSVSNLEVNARKQANMAKKYPSSKWVPLDVQRHLEPDVLVALGLGERIEEWYAPWLGKLGSIDAYDAPAILAWRNETIKDARRNFNLEAPISMIVTSAAGHVKVLQEPCPAYHAIREGARFRDALSSIAARVAHDDALFESMYSKFDASSVSYIVDGALFELLSSNFGDVERAFWTAAVEINRVEFGLVLSIDFQEFIDRLPPAKAQP